MTINLKLFFLGPPRVEQAGEPVEIQRRKALALLTYLALSGEPQQRDTLATMLWPASDQSRARGSLTRDLSILNKQLGGESLALTPQTAGLHPETATWLDVTQFQTHLKAAQSHAHPASEPCPTCLRELSTAVELYRADFLTGFSLSGCSDFDTWQTYQTEHLRQRLAAALDRLVEIYQSLSDYETALTYARRRLTLDPLHEPAHRALMMLYAISDQPSAALRQYAQCHDTLSTELDLAPGVETTALYHRIRSGDFQQVTVGDASPPIDKLPLLLPKSARSPVRHNLPPEPTPFIGRQDELNTLDTLLATPEVRLITIAGAGGTGKTRLALAAAQRQVNQANFAHGIYFISLARLSDPDLIVPAIAEALNFTFYEKVAPRQQLLNYLGQKKMLLILDNFEHLLGIADSGEPVGVDLVKAVLQHAPQVKLLITSRERLHLRQEQLYPIHGLTFSDQITAEAVISSDAVSLFLQCARRIRPELRVEADDLTDLIDICRLVEGMPLGLELAAAWVDLLSLADIATEIQESLDFLISDDHDRPDRHRSMRAVFDTTWQRLTEVEQQVLVQLSIFRGGFTRAAAQAVMGSSLATLAALTNKSLLHYHRSRDRYEIHELLRQYGEEKLTLASTSEKAAYDRHCAYYCSQLHQLESELKGSRRPRAIKEIEADIQNIRVAWQWASNQGQVERLHEALESLNRFYEWQGMDQEGEAVCFHTTKNLASITTPISLRLSAQLFAWQGVFNKRMGNIARWEQLLRQSMAVLNCSELANYDVRLEKAFVLLQMGGVNRAQVKQFRGQSAALYQAINDKWGAATALQSVGDACQMLGQHREAGKYLQQSLQIHQQIDYKKGVADCLRSLGLLEMNLGNYEKAEQLVRNSLEIMRQTCIQADVADTLRRLGTVLLYAGKFDECVASLNEHFKIYQDQGRSQSGFIPIANLSHALLHIKRWAQAQPTIESALTESRLLGNQFRIGYSLIPTTMIALVSGKYHQAATMAQECVTIWQRSNYHLFLGQALALSGFAACELGNFAEAEQFFVQAMTIGKTHSTILPLLYALPGIALLLARQEKHEQGIQIYASASCHLHVANSHWFEDVAGRQIAAAAETLPPAVVAAAEARGRARDLWETAAELLAEFEQTQSVI